MAKLSSSLLSIGIATRIAQTLSVGGSANITGTTHLVGAAVGSSTLSIAQTTTLTGAATLNSTLTTTGASTLKSTLSVGGHANLTNSLFVGDKITVGGNYVLPAAIGSSGYALKVPSSGNVLEWGEVASTTGTSLALSQTFTVDAATTLKNTLSVSGNTRITADLSIGAATNLKTTLSVGGHANLTNSLFVGDKITVGGNYVLPAAIGSSGYALKVPSSGNVLEWGEVASTTGTSLALSQTFTVDAATTLKNTLSVSGNTRLASVLSVGGASVLSGTLTTTGATTLKSTLSIGSDVVIGGNSSSARLAVKSSGDFNAAEGLASFKDFQDREICIGGLGLFRRDANSNADLRLNFIGYNGGISAFRDLDIYDGKSNKFATFQGSTQRFGLGTPSPAAKLDVVGTTKISQTLSVGGTLQIGDNSLRLDNSQHYYSLTNSGGSLYLTSVSGGIGNTRLLYFDHSTGNAAINKGLSVGGATRITQTLSVGGHANLTDSAFVGGTFTIGQATSNGSKFTFPTSSGSSGQILKLNSDGQTLGWAADATGGGASLDVSTMTVQTATTLKQTLSVGGLARLSEVNFGAAISNKITLYDNGGNNYAFGIANNSLNYSVTSTGDAHRFYQTGTSTELFRIGATSLGTGSSKVSSLVDHICHGTLSVAGASTLTGTLSVGGIANLAANMYVFGNVGIGTTVPGAVYAGSGFPANETLLHVHSKNDISSRLVLS